MVTDWLGSIGSKTSDTMELDEAMKNISRMLGPNFFSDIHGSSGPLPLNCKDAANMARIKTARAVLDDTIKDDADAVKKTAEKHYREYLEKPDLLRSELSSVVR